jgi:hypothetical protein
MEHEKSLKMVLEFGVFDFCLYMTGKLGMVGISCTLGSMSIRELVQTKHQICNTRFTTHTRKTVNYNCCNSCQHFTHAWLLLLLHSVLSCKTPTPRFIKNRENRRTKTEEANTKK